MLERGRNPEEIVWHITKSKVKIITLTLFLHRSCRLEQAYELDSLILQNFHTDLHLIFRHQDLPLHLIMFTQQFEQAKELEKINKQIPSN